MTTACFRRLAVMIGLAAVLLASACSSSSSTAPKAQSGPEKTHLVVAVLPAVNTAPLYLAIKEGYFRQVGLTVTPKPLGTSTEAIPGLLHGTIDITTGNLDSYLEAADKGVLSLRILAESATCSAGALEVLAIPRAHITTPAQLAGKTIGVTQASNIQTLTINKILASDHVSPATVHYVVMQFPVMNAALAAGRVDAVSELEPFIAAAKRTIGATVALDECTGPTAGIPLGGYFTSQGWVSKYPNTAHAFQRAMAKAQALAGHSPQAVRQILPTFMKITPQVASLITLPQFATGLSAAGIQQVADLAHAGGLMPTSLDVTPLLVH
jgi:NitT/TauT family transport system substrate-binding protein